MIRSFAILLVVLAFTGCAGGLTANVRTEPAPGPTDVGDAEKDPQEIVLENKALRRILVDLRFVRDADPASLSASVTLEPVAMPRNLALTFPVEGGCGSVPGGLAITNATDLHLAVVIDGQEVLLVDRAAVTEQLSPGKAAFVCPTGKDHYHLRFIAYGKRGDRSVKVLEQRAVVRIAPDKVNEYVADYAALAQGK